LNILTKYGIIIASVLALGVMIYWLMYDPVKKLEISLPGLDSIPSGEKSIESPVSIGEFFEKYENIDNALRGKWVKFRGADSDNIVKDKIRLINSFGNSGPKINWEVELGEGHAAPVIQNGKVYILDYL